MELLAEPTPWNWTYDSLTIGSKQWDGYTPLLGLVAVASAYPLLLAFAYTFTEQLKPVLGLAFYHNVLLSLFSGGVFVAMTYIMATEGHFASFEDVVCRPVVHPQFQTISFLFLLSKVWEWFDTVLLIVKGKRVITLHALHHMTTFWLYAVDHTFKSSIKYGVAINALIHFVMYAHYAKPFPPAYRQMITQLQIVQFILSIWFHTMIYVKDCDAKVHTHFMEYLTPYIFVVPYLMLFLRFYVQNYFNQKKGTKSTKTPTPTRTAIKKDA